MTADPYEQWEKKSREAWQQRMVDVDRLCAEGQKVKNAADASGSVEDYQAFHRHLQTCLTCSLVYAWRKPDERGAV